MRTHANTTGEVNRLHLLWFQLHESEYFLVSFLLYDSKLIIFGLWTKLDFGFLGNTQHFPIFMTFHTQNNYSNYSID